MRARPRQPSRPPDRPLQFRVIAADIRLLPRCRLPTRKTPGNPIAGSAPDLWCEGIDYLARKGPLAFVSITAALFGMIIPCLIFFGMFVTLGVESTGPTRTRRAFKRLRA